MNDELAQLSEDEKIARTLEVLENNSPYSGKAKVELKFFVCESGYFIGY